MTVFTDYVLAAMAGYWAWSLGGTRRSASATSWRWALGALALAAFSGGTTHGFPNLPDPVPGVLWKSTQVAIGVAALQVTRATALGYFPARVAAWIVRFAVAQCVAYFAWIAAHDAFIYSIVDYAVAFGFALAVHSSAALRRRDRAAGWIAAGIVISFAGAAVQALGLAPHPNFNHNDLYHVIQIAGTWLIYRGVGGAGRGRKIESGNQ